MRLSRVAGVASLALALGALLAACVVDLNGAPCSAPFGEPNPCPGGQACGYDNKCSERALACAKSRCKPGVGGECLDPSGVATTGATAQARRCTDADPVCGSWIVEPCTPSRLSCDMRAPTGGVVGAWCVCPSTAPRELTVRPEGSPRGVAPFPTGDALPFACSYRRLSDALAQAAVIVADPLAVATVTAVGAAAGGTRTFSAATTGEAFPLVVPDRVTLASDAPTGGGTYEIVFDPTNPTTAPTAPVELHSGGAIQFFTVRNGTGGETQDAIGLRCDGAPDPAVLTSVVLEGKDETGARRLRYGVVVDGTCGVAASGTRIWNFSKAGVVINSAAGAQFALTAGAAMPIPAITDCGEGIVLRNGRLVLDGARIAHNDGMGIRADDFDGIPRVEIRGSKVVWNGDTGIALVSAPEIRITSTTVFDNGATTAWGEGLLSASRKAGGVVFWGTPPAAGSFEFGRNRIYANRGDQVLVLGTLPSTLNLGSPSCGSDASGPLYTQVGCYDPASAGTTLTYRGVVAVDAKADATNLGWQSITPSRSIDYEWVGSASGVMLNSMWCPVDPTLSCSSEDPLR